MPIGILVIDHNGIIMSCNDVVERLFHIPAYHLIDKPAKDILPKDIVEQINCIQSNQLIIEKEIQCDTGFSKRIPIELIASALYDEMNLFHGYVLLLKDLTEIQTLRKEIDRSQRLASIGRLAAGVAHEIRNPLSSIKGFATYFKERFQKNPNDFDIANVMIQEVDRLNRVVSQLLEFSRPISISSTSTNMKVFIQDTIKVIERLLAEKNIHVLTNFDPDIKEVFIDKDRMNQTLLNLYLNAIEAIDRDGQIKISLLPYQDIGIEIHITDNGPGIDKEALGHIFDPYFTTKSNGTGLGLAIVYNIIEAHNGSIIVNSNKEDGTTFIIKLPQKDKPNES